RSGDSGSAEHGARNNENEEIGDDDEENGYIDLGIQLVDRAGNSVILPLSHWQPLLTAMRPKLVKSSYIKPDVQPEPIFQTFVIPLAEFAAVNSAFDPHSIRDIS